MNRHLTNRVRFVLSPPPFFFSSFFWVACPFKAVLNVEDVVAGAIEIQMERRLFKFHDDTFVAKETIGHFDL